MKKQELKVEYKKASDLIPYVNNTRTHDEKQVNQIASSIKEWGFTNPILVDEQNGIIAGHGRLMAAQKLKIENVPTITLKDLTEAQKKAYIIADNKLALNAGWNNELLMLEIENLKELDFNIELLGFSEEELKFEEEKKEEKELVEEEYKETFQILIECENEEEQEKIYNKLTEEGIKCRIQSL